MDRIIKNTDLIKSLESRYAVKKFDTSFKVRREDKEVIKKVLSLTATSYGLQPYKFIVVNDLALKKRLQEKSYGQAQVTESSFLILFCRRTDINPEHIDRYIDLMIEKTQAPKEKMEGLKSMIVNGYERKSQADRDLWVAGQIYIALGNVLTALSLMGLDSCPMEGFENDAYDEILQLADKNLKSQVLLPIGRRSPEDEYRPKVRFDEGDLFEEIN